MNTTAYSSRGRGVYVIETDMKLNLNQPADAILLDLIWRSTGIRLIEGNYEFATPKAVPNAGPWGPDTVVCITAAPVDDYRFVGSTEIAYRRLQLEDVLTEPAEPITLPALPFQTTDLLPTLNALYRLQLTASDVVNISYTAYGPVTVTAAAGSLIYAGAALLDTQSPTPMLLVPNPNLDGFVAVTA